MLGGIASENAKQTFADVSEARAPEAAGQKQVSAEFESAMWSLIMEDPFRGVVGKLENLGSE